MKTGRAHEPGLGTRARRRAKERFLAPGMACGWKLRDRTESLVDGGGRASHKKLSVSGILSVRRIRNRTSLILDGYQLYFTTIYSNWTMPQNYANVQPKSPNLERRLLDPEQHSGPMASD